MNSTFEVKSIQFNSLSIKLKNSNPLAVEAELKEIGPRYLEYQFFPYLLDCSSFSSLETDEIKTLIQIFKNHHINTIGLSHCKPEWAKKAEEMGLFFQLVAPKTTDSEQKNKPTRYPTRFIDKPVRSGQQVYAEKSDLIITSLVSEGSEIAADGNMQVYAPVRGRVFAGASGDISARIFILSMQAQMVCIAGIYRLFEQCLPDSLNKKSVSIVLLDNKLSILGVQ